MKKPVISVIVPIYNTEAYLEECLENLIHQTLKDIEILCIDDGSTDGSLQILERYACLDSRIKIFKQNNLGPGAARNIGLEQATGDYLMFCDSDDVYNLHACKEMHQAMINNSVDLVMCDIDVVSNNIKDKRFEDESAYHTLYHKGTLRLTPWAKRKVPVPLWGKLFKMELIKKYCLSCPAIFRGDDTAFSWKYLSISKKAYGIDKKLYQYRLRENSIMGKFFTLKETQQFFDYLPVFQNVINFLNKNNLLEKNLWVLESMTGRIQWALSCFNPSQKRSFLKKLRQNVLSFIPIDILRKNSTLFSYFTRQSFFIEKRGDKKIYYLLGIPFFKEKNTKKAQKYYFLGLRVYKKTNNFAPSSEKPSLTIQQTVSVKSYKDLAKAKDLKTKTINPIFDNNSLPIVFNCDNHFVKYFSVALQSILDCSSDALNYDIVVLHTNILQENQKILKNMVAHKKNFSVRFFNMSDYEKSYAISELTTLRHVKTAAYYRLFIPEIFSTYSKVIYLDADLIVKEDPSTLFNIDLKGCACAAVPDLCLSLVKKNEEICFPGIYEYAKNVLNFTNWQNYFNSGVMVYDIPKILSQGYFEKFMQVAKINNQFFHDQNVLNSVLQNDTFLLEDLWNVQINGTSTHFSLQGILNPNEAKILHFCSPQKPWNDSTIFCASDWWNYAKKTPFYEVLSKEITQTIIDT